MTLTLILQILEYATILANILCMFCTFYLSDIIYKRTEYNNKVINVICSISPMYIAINFLYMQLPPSEQTADILSVLYRSYHLTIPLLFGWGALYLSSIIKVLTSDSAKNPELT